MGDNPPVPPTNTTLMVAENRRDAQKCSVVSHLTPTIVWTHSAINLKTKSASKPPHKWPALKWSKIDITFLPAVKSVAWMLRIADPIAAAAPRSQPPPIIAATSKLDFLVIAFTITVAVLQSVATNIRFWKRIRRSCAARMDGGGGQGEDKIDAKQRLRQLRAAGV